MKAGSAHSCQNHPKPILRYDPWETFFAGNVKSSSEFSHRLGRAERRKVCTIISLIWMTEAEDILQRCVA